MIVRLLIGFVAAAVAVLLVHQPIIAALAAAKVIPAVAFNMEPFKTAPAAIAQAFSAVGFNGFPTLFNLMFWGGLWGVLYGAVLAPLPQAAWLKGLLLGAIVVVAGNWLLVPLIKGGVLFGGFDPKRMAITALINVPFGIATGLIYGALRRDGSR